ncbi:hypothetical protein lerEdw1_011477 [Lerista edwardsae]|nr:hypothetical protein lerEdw1_011477 [Lerista edwardsae]
MRPHRSAKPQWAACSHAKWAASARSGPASPEPRAGAAHRSSCTAETTPGPASPRPRPAPPAPPGGAMAAGAEEGRTGGLLDGPRCRALYTARGACHLLQLLLGLLILACSSVSYGAAGGYTGLLSLGSPYYYQYGGAYSGLSGADGARAQRLDAQFHQLKQPPARAAMAVGGALMAVACLLLLAGLGGLPRRCPAWLLAEGVLQAAVATGLVPGLYFYYRSLQDTYDTPLCRERERLYHSKGYQGFGCSLHGAEIGVGFVTGAAIVAFFVGTGLALRDFRSAQQPHAKPAEMHQV